MKTESLSYLYIDVSNVVRRDKKNPGGRMVPLLDSRRANLLLDCLKSEKFLESFDGVKLFVDSNTLSLLRQECSDFLEFNVTETLLQPELFEDKVADDPLIENAERDIASGHSVTVVTGDEYGEYRRSHPAIMTMKRVKIDLGARALITHNFKEIVGFAATEAEQLRELKDQGLRERAAQTQYLSSRYFCRNFGCSEAGEQVSINWKSGQARCSFCRGKLVVMPASFPVKELVVTVANSNVPIERRYRLGLGESAVLGRENSMENLDANCVLAIDLIGDLENPMSLSSSAISVTPIQRGGQFYLQTKLISSVNQFSVFDGKHVFPANPTGQLIPERSILQILDFNGTEIANIRLSAKKRLS